MAESDVFKENPYRYAKDYHSVLVGVSFCTKFDPDPGPLLAIQAALCLLSTAKTSRDGSLYQVRLIP